MMYCAKFGYIELIGMLLRQGAVLETVDSKGRTVLHHAGMWGQVRVCVYVCYYPSHSYSHAIPYNYHTNKY